MKAKLLSTSAAVHAAPKDQGADKVAMLPAEQLAALREMFETENGVATKLNDEQLSVMVADQGGKELADEDWVALIEGVEETLADDTDDKELSPADEAAKVAVMSKVGVAAVAASKKAENDGELNALVAETVDHEKKARTRPLVYVRILQRIHGEELKSFPAVGSDYDPKSNSAWDNYQYSVTATNGEKATVRGSFWRDYALNLPLAKDLAEKIAGIKETEGQKAGGKIANANLRKELTADIEAIVRAIKIAARTYQQFERVNSECGAVEAYHYKTWEKDDKGALIKDDKGNKVPKWSVAKEPIYIGSTDKEEKDAWDFYSVSQFLSMKPDVCKAAGGGFAALVATMKRPPKTPGGDLPATTAKNFIAYVANTLNFLQMSDGDNVKTFRKMLDTGKADALGVTMADLRDTLSEILTDFESAPAGKPSKLFTLRRKEAEAAAAIAAAKAKAAA